MMRLVLKHKGDTAFLANGGFRLGTQKDFKATTTGVEKI